MRDVHQTTYRLPIGPWLKFTLVIIAVTAMAAVTYLPAVADMIETANPHGRMAILLALTPTARVIAVQGFFSLIAILVWVIGARRLIDRRVATIDDDGILFR